MNKKILYALVDIYMGDCEIEELCNEYTKEFTMIILEYLINHEYVFVVKKVLQGNIEKISVVDKEISEIQNYRSYAIEFTAEGRKKYIDKENFIKELKQLF